MADKKDAKGIKPKLSKKAIQFAIKKIEILNHKKNCADDFKIVPNELIYNLSCDIRINTEESTIKIIVDYNFIQSNTVLLELKVENLYDVKNLNDYIINGEFSKTDFLQYIIQASVHHTRGVQARLFENTALQYFYIPILPAAKIISSIVKEKQSNISKS